MRIYIEQTGTDGQISRTRPVAEWELPDGDEPLEVSFCQLATPSSNKVAVFRITVIPGKGDGR